MSTPLDETVPLLDPVLFGELVAGLGDESAKRREAALLRYQASSVRDARLDAIVANLAASDPKDYVRTAAQGIIRQVPALAASALAAATSGTYAKPSAPPIVLVSKGKGPGCIVSALWFLFIGWWLGAFVIALAWLLNITIILLPLGMAILNNIPKLLTLQDSDSATRVVTRDGVTTVTEASLPQHPFWLRAVFFLLIGFWWSGIWLALGYFCCLTILLMPVGFQVFRLAPAMTTLRRY